MLDQLEEESGVGPRWLAAIAIIVFLIGAITDLILDAPTSWLSLHVLVELLMVAAALLFLTGMAVSWRRAERRLEDVRRSLAERSAERDAWQESAERALFGLGAAIDEQFERWQLTQAEKEVALLLLKGYSHKHIASDTGRSERTVRQHAVAIYQKAGLAGRAELAGFFLEDLRLPHAPRPS